MLCSAASPMGTALEGGEGGELDAGGGGGGGKTPSRRGGSEDAHNVYLECFLFTSWLIEPFDLFSLFLYLESKLFQNECYGRPVAGLDDGPVPSPFMLQKKMRPEGPLTLSLPLPTHTLVQPHPPPPKSILLLFTLPYPLPLIYSYLFIFPLFPPPLFHFLLFISLVFTKI